MTGATAARRLVGEALGTALLLATVVGSGIMAERLSGGNDGLALLANTLATGAVLPVLILWKSAKCVGPASSCSEPCQQPPGCAVVHQRASRTRRRPRAAQRRDSASRAESRPNRSRHSMAAGPSTPRGGWHRRPGVWPNPGRRRPARPAGHQAGRPRRMTIRRRPLLFAAPVPPGRSEE